MTEYLPDFHECGEARAEQYMLPDGKVKCAGCGGAFDACNVQGSSVDPYSAPVCDACLVLVYPALASPSP